MHNLYRSKIKMAAAFLLPVYLAVFLIPKGLIPHHHHGHSGHEGDLCLNDPCHISIYHHGVAGGCDHKYHFTAGDDDCDQCDLLPVRQVVSPEIRFQQLLIAAGGSLPDHLPVSAYATDIVHADRGPPGYTFLRSWKLQRSR